MQNYAANKTNKVSGSGEDHTYFPPRKRGLFYFILKKMRFIGMFYDG